MQTSLAKPLGNNPPFEPYHARYYPYNDTSDIHPAKFCLFPLPPHGPTHGRLIRHANAFTPAQMPRSRLQRRLKSPPPPKPQMWIHRRRREKLRGSISSGVGSGRRMWGCVRTRTLAAPVARSTIRGALGVTGRMGTFCFCKPRDLHIHSFVSLSTCSPRKRTSEKQKANGTAGGEDPPPKKKKKSVLSATLSFDTQDE